MADAKRTHDWDQASLLWSAIANTVRDPEKQRKPFSPGLVHPYRSEEDYEPKPIETGIDVLKMLLPENMRSKDGGNRRSD